MYGTALFIVLVLVVIYILTCSYGSLSNLNPLSLVKYMGYKGYRMVSSVLGSTSRVTADYDDGFYGGSGPQRVDDIGKSEGPTGEINTTDSAMAYDPSLLGAVKECEVKAHKDNLKNKSNFSTTGVVNSSRIERTDDDILRETGVPYVGFPPKRSLKAFPNGPQSGARAAPSTSEHSINALYKSSKKSQSWVS
jgi:hypothetical protein